MPEQVRVIPCKLLMQMCIYEKATSEHLRRAREKKQQVECYPHLDLHSIGAIAQQDQGLSLMDTSKRR